MVSDVRVRFAPSPTGSLHIGNMRTAVFNWLFARHHNGDFILRIEDTDLLRSSRDSEQGIISDMRWMGLSYDEGPGVGGSYGPYRQSERTGLYREYAERLLEEGLAYRCYCSDEELEEEREKARKRDAMPKYSGRCRQLSEKECQDLAGEGRKPAIRFRVPAGKQVVVRDCIRGEVDFNSDVIGDFVLMKSNGTPAYNFAVVVDDALMEITHVIRAEDHLSNTPKQLLLYDALGFSIPEFAHAGMILGPDGSPLSKRHGATSVAEYRRLGYLPEAMVNYLALLGWSPGDEQEIFTQKELIERFDLGGVSKSSAVFDIDKLKWMNGEYIRSADIEDLTQRCLPYLQKAGYIDDDEPDAGEMQRLTGIVDVVRDGLDCLQEIAEEDRIGYWFDDDLDFEDEQEAEDVLGETGVEEVLRTIVKKIEDSDQLDPDRAQIMIGATIDELDCGGRMVYHPLRMALTGKGSGPELHLILGILGKERILSRLQSALDTYTD